MGSSGCGPGTERAEPVPCTCVSVPLAMIGPLGRSEGAEGWRLGGLACDDVTAVIELVCGVWRERERERERDTELLNPTQCVNE